MLETGAKMVELMMCTTFLKPRFNSYRLNSHEPLLLATRRISLTQASIVSLIAIVRLRRRRNAKRTFPDRCLTFAGTPLKEQL